VPAVVYELILSARAREKLGRRGISEREVLQLLWNSPDLPTNPHAPTGSSRRLLIGETNGGRALTVVIEETHDPTTWRVITGWESRRRELR
jgi:uncharacterized DUF497 family protein